MLDISISERKIRRMIQSPGFNFIDVLWTPWRALMPKKIAVMTFFLVLALAVYNVFTYLALAIQGESIGFVFSAYGFFYFSTAAFTSVFAQVIFGIGVVGALLAVMLGFFGVAAIEIEEVRGNRFMSFGKAVGFAFRRLGQIFLAELAIVLFLLVIVLLFFILGLVTRIPYLGEWIFSLFFVLPNFVVAFFVIIIAAILQISFVLLPAVSAAERHGETFNSILETFSTVLRQPLRWLGYTAYSLVAAKLVGFIYAYFCFRAVQFVVWATSLGAGDKVRKLVASGLSHLPIRSDTVRETFNIFPGVDWSFSVSHWARGGGGEAAGYVMAFMLFVVFASIIGYMLAVVASAQARGFVAIRYIKDNYKISDEDPLFFEEEHVNPPVEDVDGFTEKSG